MVVPAVRRYLCEKRQNPLRSNTGAGL